MRKNRHIFLLGALFFLLALIKYAFIGDELPTTFIVFEILSFFVILYLIYYLLNFIETCMHGSSDAKMDKECISREAENSRLRAKLERIEQEKLNDDIEDEVDNALLLAQIKTKIDFNAQSVRELIDVLTQRYEVMAAIGYCTNNDKQYIPVKTYGIDDEITISPITFDDGLHAQAIADNKAMAISDIPADYIEVGSGSGNAKPLVLYILPIINGDNGIVIELATFKKLDIVKVWNQLVEVQ